MPACGLAAALTFGGPGGRRGPGYLPYTELNGMGRNRNTLRHEVFHGDPKGLTTLDRPPPGERGRARGGARP